MGESPTIKARCPDDLMKAINLILELTGMTQTEFVLIQLATGVENFPGDLKKYGIDFKDIAKIRKMEFLRNVLKTVRKNKKSLDLLPQRVCGDIITYMRYGKSNAEIIELLNIYINESVLYIKHEAQTNILIELRKCFENNRIDLAKDKITEILNNKVLIQETNQKVIKKIQLKGGLRK